MAALSRFTAEGTLFLRALLRGCAQLAFCDSPSAGLLVLAGIALASPLAGLGTLLGALFGTVTGRFIPAYGREEWAWGLTGFNPAIIGLLWGGLFATGEVHPALLIPVFALSMLLDVGFRRLLGRLMLPSLSSGALTTVYIVSLLAASPGGWFWTDAPTNAFVPFGLLGATCVFAAMVIKSPFAGLWAFLLSAMTFLSGWITDHDPRTLVGLWGITVPLACFGVHAIFLRGSLAGCVAGSLAALFGALIWIGWEASPLARWLPPLLLPFILGVWLSIIVMRKLTAVPLAQPAFWRVARVLAAARGANREVVALIQRGTDPGGAPSSFVSGTWLDPQVPRSAFDRERLQASLRSRQVFWDACDRLRDQANGGAPGDLLARVSRLQRNGWLQAVVMQDVTVPAEFATLGGAVPLHGDIARTQCLHCGAESGWPPLGVWRRCDLRCAVCQQGAVVPSVTVFGGALDDATSSRLRELEARCAVVLVLGAEASEPATLAFLERARKAGTTVVFITDGAPVYPRRPTDISVFEPPGRFLAFLQVVLAGVRVVYGPWTSPAPRGSATLASGKRGREVAG